MMTNNSAMYSIKIIGEIGRDILSFPLWWYSGGLLLFIKKLAVFLDNRQKSLALWVWIKNIHRPMYGQYNWQGMLISFFVRVVQIIIRSMAMLIWLIIALAMLCCWLALPVLTIYQIIFQIAL